MTRDRLHGARIHAIIGAAAAWLGLGLQYVLLVRGNDLGPIGATIRFFSYFTILTNTLVACAFTSALRERNDGNRGRLLMVIAGRRFGRRVSGPSAA